MKSPIRNLNDKALLYRLTQIVLFRALEIVLFLQLNAGSIDSLAGIAN
jgi:hypothetical protein